MDILFQVVRRASQKSGKKEAGQKLFPPEPLLVVFDAYVDIGLYTHEPIHIEGRISFCQLLNQILFQAVVHVDPGRGIRVILHVAKIVHDACGTIAFLKPAHVIPPVPFPEFLSSGEEGSIEQKPVHLVLGEAEVGGIPIKIGQVLATEIVEARTKAMWHVAQAPGEDAELEMKIRFQGLAEETADETVHFLVIAMLCGAHERSIVFINQDDSPLFKLGMQNMRYGVQGTGQGPLPVRV